MTWRNSSSRLPIPTAGVLALGLLCTSLLCGESHVQPALRPVEPVEYQLPWTTGADGFNLVLALSRSEGLRVVFDFVDAHNHYLLKLTATQATLLLVEQGLELPLAAGRLASKGGRFLLRRRRERIELTHDETRVLKFFDRTFREGRVGFGGRLESIFRGKPRFQPVAPVYFRDDFMRGEGEAGEWDPIAGQWQTQSLQNPLRSANAFKYAGQATEARATALAGHWFWDDYEFGATFKSPTSAATGLLFAYQDGENFLQARWSGGAHPDGGQIELAQVRQGQRSMLLKRDFGYRPNQWYRLKVVQDGDRVDLYVDRAHVGRATATGIVGGKVGLFTESDQPVLFDDVRVSSVQDFEADFSELDAGRWLQLGGEWEGRGPKCRASAPEGSLAVVGDAKWYGYEVAADVLPGRKSVAGLVLFFQDAANYVLFVLDRPSASAQIIRVRDQKPKVLAEVPLPPRRGRRKVVRLVARASANLVTASVDGVGGLQADVGESAEGRVGLYVRGKKCAFSHFSVSFPDRTRTALVAHHRVFSGEVSMANWSSAQRDWVRSTEKPEAGEHTTGWHRVDLPGDLELRLPLRQFPFKSDGGHPPVAALYLGAAESSPDSGYALELAAGAALEMRLSRATRLLARHTFGAVEPRSLWFRRVGGYLLGFLNGNRVFAVKDEQPLSGSMAGWSAIGMLPETERMDVFTEQVVMDTFETAPSDWVAAQGLWEVSNRWQCDPRWSFFSGQTRERTNKVAAWHKAAADPQELAVEVVIGQKMTQELGSYGQYARDYNLAICADGRDLSSGYSFVFGGWGNTRTAIVRKTEVLAEETEPVIDTRGLHRRWYVLKAQKAGQRLQFYVDDKLVLSCEDPKPLTGRRIAVWSAENSIMVARVRISSPQPLTWGLPNQGVGGECRSFYDELADE